MWFRSTNEEIISSCTKHFYVEKKNTHRIFYSPFASAIFRTRYEIERKYLICVFLFSGYFFFLFLFLSFLKKIPYRLANKIDFTDTTLVERESSLLVSSSVWVFIEANRKCVWLVAGTTKCSWKLKAFASIHRIVDQKKFQPHFSWKWKVLPTLRRIIIWTECTNSRITWST